MAQGSGADAPVGIEGQDEGEEIIVTGIRGGLTQALNIKRSSDSIVDAISAEDVGKFPDTNIAESVQRITGVQINRTRGEGRTVNIRGLPANFTLTTLNGRTVPNAFSFSSSRSFDFAVLPPEFVRSLEVYKAPVADMDEGGLSGSVNIRTPNALEIGKRVFSASAQGQYESNSGKWSPRVSAFYADTFAGGRIGLALGGSYTARKPETHSVTNAYTTSTEGAGIASGSAPNDLNGDGVIEPNRRVRIPNYVVHSIQPEDRERTSLVGSLDVAASGALSFSLSGFYSRVVVDSVEARLNNFASWSTSGTTASAESLSGLDTITDITFDDLDLRGNGRMEDRVSHVWSSVLGAKYEKGGWTVSVEGSYGSSRETMGNLNIAALTNGVARYEAKPGFDVPNFTYSNGFDQARLDPNSYRIGSLNGSFNRGASDDLWDAKFDVTREFSGALSAVRFGAKYTSRSQYQDNNFLTVTGARVSQLYGGLPAGPRPGSISVAPLMYLATPGSGSFLGSFSGNGVFPTSWLVSDARGFIANFSDDELIAAGTLTNDATGIIDVKERIFATYARADFSFGRLSGNVGLRAARTAQETSGVIPDLNNISVGVDQGNVTRVPSAGDTTVRRAYWDFLPSLNLKFEVRPDLMLRFAASRTMSRPNLADVSPTTTANGLQRTVTRNNPYLNPFRATNFDLTAEWYFRRDSVLGASLFYKRLDSLIRRETVTQSLPVRYINIGAGTEVVNNVDYSVSQLINGSGVSVKGAEVYYQQAFTALPGLLSGFGTILNYTFIDNSDPTQLTAASRHNFNAILYYERGILGARASYSWRDGFLSSAGTGDILSQETLAFGTLDASVSLKVHHNASLVFEAVNLLDSDEVSRYTNGLPAAYVDVGRRVSVGARISF